MRIGDMTEDMALRHKDDRVVMVWQMTERHTHDDGTKCYDMGIGSTLNRFHEDEEYPAEEYTGEIRYKPGWMK